MTEDTLSHSSDHAPSVLKRILRGIGWCVLFLFAASIVATVILRFVPPCTSGVMIERYVESLNGTLPYDKKSPALLHYHAYYHWVPLADIAPVMGIAAVTSEDQEFAEHSGFDWKAIARAIEYNQKHHRTRGASTISQQTAKNLFLWDGHSWLRKGLEAYFTVLIETFWNKERILEVYLNIVEFGDGIYGVDAASQQFFNKPASRLNAGEAALLAAVLPNPHLYHVNKPGGYLLERRNWILKNMHTVGGAEYIKSL
jgi:monofunctional biosynthetic peptidoglycan transglycosylase